MKLRWDSGDNSFSVWVKGAKPQIRERVQANHLWGFGENESVMKTNAKNLKDQWVINLGSSTIHSHPEMADKIFIREAGMWGQPFYQSNGKGCHLTSLMTLLPVDSQKDIKTLLPLPKVEVDEFMNCGSGKSYLAFLDTIKDRKYLPYRVGIVEWTQNKSPTDVLKLLVDDMTIAKGIFIIICGAHCIVVNTILGLFVDTDSNSPTPFLLTMHTLKKEGIDRCNELLELKNNTMLVKNIKKYRETFTSLC